MARLPGGRVDAPIQTVILVRDIAIAAFRILDGANVAVRVVRESRYEIQAADVYHPPLDPVQAVPPRQRLESARVGENDGVLSVKIIVGGHIPVRRESGASLPPHPRSVKAVVIQAIGDESGTELPLVEHV